MLLVGLAALLALQTSTAQLRVTVSVIDSCHIALTSTSDVAATELACAAHFGPPPRVRPDTTQYGPVVLIEF